jgi:hypothetical protein
LGYRADFDPGLRVEAEFAVDHEVGHDPEDGSPYFETEKIIIQGTVMGDAANSRKIRVWLDEYLDENGTRGIVRLFPDRLRVIGGKVHVCIKCGRPDGMKNNPKWYCEECGDLGDAEPLIRLGVESYLPK